MAENKTKPTEIDALEYISGLEPERRRDDAMVVLKMMKNISGSEPVMWGPTAIGFGNYHYIYESGREGDAPLLTFAPRKANLVLYILTNFRGQEELLAKLGKYKTGKVCLYLNKLEDVDMKVLEDITQNAFNHMTRVSEKMNS